MKKGAIFDMDGTLLDTERLYQESWIYLAKEYGQVPNPDFPLAVCGSNGAEMISIIQKYYPEVDARQFMKDCYARVAQLVENGAPIKNGAHEMLTFLKEKGMRLAVASSNTHGQIEKNLEKAGLLHYFDALVGGDEVENGKPYPDIFQLAAKQIACAPEECYAFEDGMNGIRAASAAGCSTIMVVDLTPLNEEAEAICTGIYDSLLEAFDAVKQQSGN